MLLHINDSNFNFNRTIRSELKLFTKLLLLLELIHIAVIA